MRGADRKDIDVAMENSRDDKKLKNWGLRDDYYRWGKDWKASQDPEAAATMNSIIDGVQGVM